MNKFSNFIKKLLLICCVLLMICTPINVFARAGGGSSGGGSSGGSGGTSGGSRSSDSYHGGGSSGGYNRRRNNPVADIIAVSLMAVSASIGIIVIKVRMGQKKIKSAAVIKSLSKSDDNWNYANIKQDVEEAFYKVQLAWTERNQDIAKEYMSEELYIRHKTQTEWMKVRKEKNILKRMTLLGVYPIGVEDFEGTENDILWMHIKAKSIDYTIDEETNKVTQGSKYRRVYFEEYWKFIRRDHRWVLDDIKQLEDIDDLSFFGTEIDHKK
ncbi:Tim44 domain-containing protein [Clostridium sp. 19966]|uniref:Tim44 domain-containing protein n=1 Tax=Clostridium sp. 19966 TaxID=2768166 RepID=UPI0028E00097|nr:Tim44-like domain-containing protein [Clostridium sp. 19966]MDT8715961.1 Tim44 domain-containing protein [Clostridium sp. 19966]